MLVKYIYKCKSFIIILINKKKWNIIKNIIFIQLYVKMLSENIRKPLSLRHLNF